MMRTLEAILAEHAFFAGLPDQHLKLLAGCAKNVHFDAESYIAREQEDANEFYLLRFGQVALEIFVPNRGPVTIATLGEGEVLGWSWLVPPHRWVFDVRALSLVRAIALDGRCLRGKSEEDPRLGYELMKRFATVMANRLQATRFQLLDIYAKPCR